LQDRTWIKAQVSTPSAFSLPTY